MGVYCDPLFSCEPSAVWPWREASHLFTDCADLAELHALAARIGLRRAWFQNKPGRLPHYDLTRAKQAAAIRAGAVLLTRAEAVAKWRAIRAGDYAAPPAPTPYQFDFFHPSQCPTKTTKPKP